MMKRVGCGLISLVFAACQAGEGEIDGGLLDAGRNRPPCAVDRQDTPAAALQLTAGTPHQGEAAVCPITDRDWYKFDVPEDQALVTIEVNYPAGATTPVELAYELFGGEAATSTAPRAKATVQDMVAGDNRSAISSSHYLLPGAYYLRVRDIGDDEQDVLNNYGVKVTTAPDMDPNEPNENCGAATVLGANGGGTIAFAGDVDAYSFNVPAGAKIIDITLTNQGMSPVDLHLGLYSGDGATFFYDTGDDRGEDGPTNVRLRYGIQSSGGTFCVTVGDNDGGESDPMSQYSLVMRVDDEPDTNEQAGRNDTPATATMLTSGMARTGIIPSQNDLDWYRIATPVGTIIEVDVDCPGCTIQPQINLVYRSTTSPCDDSLPCDYILDTMSCTGDSDCASRVCREIAGGGKHCAQSCEGPLDCGSFECNQGGNVNACVASASCITGQCGVLQYTAPNDVENPSNSPTRIRTAQPAIVSSTFILVHDFQDDDFTDRTYTLNVSVVPDPDANEPNNFYYPYTFVDTGDILSAGRMMATDAPWTGAGPKVASGSGCIAYQGDIDVFRLSGGNPCAVTSTTGGGMPGGNCGLELTYSRPGGSIDLAWFLYSGGFGPRASFLASMEGMETVFGDNACVPGQPSECMVHNADEEEDYYLVVRDFGQDAWETSAARCYTWTMRSAATSGCPATCPTVRNGLCECR